MPFMSRIVGIDLGTTNSLVATVDSGIPLVIADADGRRLTPSVVNFPAGEAPGVAGYPAARLRVAEPARTVYSIKRFMGRRGSDVPESERRVTYPVHGSGTGAISVRLGERSVSPEEISACILRKLKADAERFFNEAVTRAVITVPAYFNDAQRNATKQAGELAGLTVERILNEPTAAALAYGLDRLKDRARVAVYDLGGGTFDLSILELSEGVFQVLSTSGNTCLGGDDIDRKLTEFLLDKIQQAGGPETLAALKPDEWPRDPEQLSLLARVREAAERAKIELSTTDETDIVLPFLAPNFSFQMRLPRVQLEDLAREVIQRTRPHCLRALADAKLQPKDLDQVILVGGQTRMPLVRRFVGELFGCVDFEEVRGQLRLGSDYHRATGPQLNTSQNPDEAVALGTAIQAEILAGNLRNVLLLDVTPLSLGLETFGGLMNVLIPRNSTIPTKAGEMFTTAVDYQREMLIHVLQGERERATDNWSLGKFTIDFEAAARGVARVGVQFEIDANGILHVLARDTRSGAEKVVEIKSAVDVDDQAVQQMVDESIEYAFEDLAARRWIEARLKAGEMLAAARNALAGCEDAISSETRAQVQGAMATLELAMQEDAVTKTGDLSRLKAAIASLDQASLPVAELLMDRAMDTLLRQRGII
jgi:molecular chaperone DnaK